MSEFREGVKERTAAQKAKDEARLAELKAKEKRTQGEEEELQALSVGLPAETPSEQRARVYKEMEDLSDDQWKSILDLLRRHNMIRRLMTEEEEEEQKKQEEDKRKRREEAPDVRKD